MRLRPVPLLSGLVLAPGLVSLCTGCGTGCDRTPDMAPTEYRGGTTDRVQLVYESAPVDGPYLDFPGGRTYRFFHTLGGVPKICLAYFAFDEYPVSGSRPSGMVLGGGNQGTFESVTSTYIDVRNDTCSDVRIRVVASDPDLTSTGDAGP